MNIGRILFLAIFLLSATLLLATTSILHEVKFSYNVDSTSNVTALEQLQLKKEYQAKLLEVLVAYSQSDKMENLKQDAGLLEEELLGIPTPKEYRDLHFKIITSIDKLKNGSVSALTETRLSLESLIKDYSWLASTLSLFIINNFS